LANTSSASLPTMTVLQSGMRSAHFSTFGM
jgi:hypothetical protein